MAEKKSGSVKRPFDFKGNVQAKGDFEVAYEVTQDQGIGVASQLTEAVNGFLDQRIKTLTAAVQDLDGKLEKLLKEAQMLSDGGKGYFQEDRGHSFLLVFQEVVLDWLDGLQEPSNAPMNSWR